MGSVVLGPGTLTIGATGAEIDVSCDLDNAVITMSKTTGTETTKLCGTVRPGATTYAYVLNGTIGQDLDLGADGLFGLSQAAPGSEQPYEYTPNTEAAVVAAGTLILDPLDFGSTGAYGEEMKSGFSFALVGQPTYTYPPVVP